MAWIKLAFRVNSDSDDPRHRQVAEWYESLPHNGRGREGVQRVLLEALCRYLDGEEAQAGAPRAGPALPSQHDTDPPQSDSRPKSARKRRRPKFTQTFS